MICEAWAALLLDRMTRALPADSASFGHRSNIPCSAVMGKLLAAGLSLVTRALPSYRVGNR
jgi:hypothetical protein